MTVPAKLTALRRRMVAHRLDACLVPSTDPHQSEYAPDRWNTRAWLSGFTGSAGTLIVTANEALLWTDSRYFIQAEQELAGTGIHLQKLKVPHTPEYRDWLADNLASGERLGLDGSVVSLDTVRDLRKQLGPFGIEVDTRHDLPGEIWEDRPALPATEVSELAKKYTGQSRADRLERAVNFMRREGVEHYLVVALDEIAWLLNIRATDVAYNPVVLSYLLLNADGDHRWYGGAQRVPEKVAKALKADGVALKKYERIEEALENLPTKLAADPALLSIRLFEAAGTEQVMLLKSPIAAWKGIKNPTEIAHLRQALLRDGLALLRLHRWMTERLAAGAQLVEDDLARELARLRATGDGYRGESFPAIVGYGANGAIVHYHAPAGGGAAVRPEGILLLDSGGHYLDGTTDITRTFALGEPTAEQRTHYTRVLQGHINLAYSRFPEGTTGLQLDVLARAPLWRDGLNFGHGTGHGIGFFLNVHEGPQSISPNAKSAAARRPFKPGMVTSNEPGYYLDGRYGIRIENLILCVKDEAVPNFLRFETLTLFPFDNCLIDRDLLSREQAAWVDEYQSRCLRDLGEAIAGEEEQEYLRKLCERGE